MLLIVLIVVAFQYWVIQKPFPNAAQLIGGTLLVLVGLTLFVRGMTMSLFSLGESLVGVLVERKHLAIANLRVLYWLCQHHRRTGLNCERRILY